LEPLVAPARVLCGQADDQLLHLEVERWPAGVAVRVGPRAGDQAPVPAQQRLGLHEEARPAGPGQHAADRGQQGAVCGLKPGTWDLPVQHRELVAEDEELQVLGGVAAGEQHEQLDGASECQVGELRQHQGGLRARSAERHTTAA